MHISAIRSAKASWSINPAPPGASASASIGVSWAGKGSVCHHDSNTRLPHCMFDTDRKFILASFGVKCGLEDRWV